MREDFMKISIVQMDVVYGDPVKNGKKVESLVRKAAAGGADLILLPEMWNTSYSFENIREIADVNGEKTEALIAPLAKKWGVNIVAGSVANISREKVFNTLFVFDRSGKRIAEYNKVHLFRLMEEHLYLSGGDSLCDFEIDGAPCGAVICYDIRFPEIVRSLALRGCRVLFVPAQWPTSRIDHWRKLLMARAIENQMYIAACNRVGSMGDNDFSGHSMIIDPWGEIVGELADGTEGILEGEINLDDVDEIRRNIPVFQDRRPSVYRLS